MSSDAASADSLLSNASPALPKSDGLDSSKKRRRKKKAGSGGFRDLALEQDERLISGDDAAAWRLRATARLRRLQHVSLELEHLRWELQVASEAERRAGEAIVAAEKRADSMQLQVEGLRVSVDRVVEKEDMLRTELGRLQAETAGLRAADRVDRIAELEDTVKAGVGRARRANRVVAVLILLGTATVFVLNEFRNSGDNDDIRETA